MKVWWKKSFKSKDIIYAMHLPIQTVNSKKIFNNSLKVSIHVEKNHCIKFGKQALLAFFISHLNNYLFQVFKLTIVLEFSLWIF